MLLISLCDFLDELIVKYPRLIMVGHFNMPGARCQRTVPPIKVQIHIQNLAASYDLTQIALEPTRGHALLDLIFVSQQFANCNVTTTP